MGVLVVSSASTSPPAKPLRSRMADWPCLPCITFFSSPLSPLLSSVSLLPVSCLSSAHIPSFNPLLEEASQYSQIIIKSLKPAPSPACTKTQGQLCHPRPQPNPYPTSQLPTNLIKSRSSLGAASTHPLFFNSSFLHSLDTTITTHPALVLRPPAQLVVPFPTSGRWIIAD